MKNSAGTGRLAAAEERRGVWREKSTLQALALLLLLLLAPLLLLLLLLAPSLLLALLLVLLVVHQVPQQLQGER